MLNGYGSILDQCADHWEGLCQVERVRARDERAFDAWLACSLLLTLAGPLAEAAHYGRPDWDAWASVGSEADRNSATTVAMKLAGDGPSASALVERAIERVRALLELRRVSRATQALAGALLKEKTLPGPRVRELLTSELRPYRLPSRLRHPDRWRPEALA
jgi:hypothetical protein